MQTDQTIRFSVSCTWTVFHSLSIHKNMSEFNFLLCFPLLLLQVSAGFDNFITNKCDNVDNNNHIGQFILKIYYYELKEPSKVI